MSISIDKAEQIGKLFSSDVSIRKISKKFDIDDRTVRAEFIRQFGKEKTDERSCRIHKLKGGRKDHPYTIQTHRPEIWDKIIGYFISDLSLKEIGKICNVSPKTVINIWVKYFGEEEYKEHCIKMLLLQKERAAKSFKKAKFLGSKNEILCYTLLKQLLPNIEVKHHDYRIVPRLELDITIPLLKIAITWDGPCHRRPIFGDNKLIKTLKNDHIREETLVSKGWCQISVVDEGHFDSEAVATVCNKIIELTQSKRSSKHIIFICGAGKAGDEAMFDAEMEEKYRRHEERIIKSETLKNDIIQAFSLDLRLGEVIKKLGCSSYTISTLWRKTFGKEATEQRICRIRGRTTENIEKIIEYFYSDLSIAEVSKKVKAYSKFVVKIWQEKFGVTEVHKRGKHISCRIGVNKGGI